MFRAPPRGIGHPATWHIAPSVSPTTGRQRTIEGQHAVCRDAGKHRPRSLVFERAHRQSFCRAQRTQSEPRENVGMMWNIGRPEHGAFELWPVLDHHADGPAIRAARRVPVERRWRRAIVPPPSRCHRRTDGRSWRTARSTPDRVSPAEESARTATRWANGWTAEQVSWTKPGSVSAADRGAAADRVVRLEDHDLASGLRKDDGRAQTVRARTDDDRVDHAYDENSRTDDAVLVLALVV